LAWRAGTSITQLARPRGCPASGRKTVPTNSSLWIPRGTVAQCDRWVTSYPESFFGDMFREPDLTRILQKSPARRESVERLKI